jgi:Flp pilus assembly protein TadD
MVVTTAFRVTAWRDPIRYWKLAAADNPGSIHVLAGLGSAYMDSGRYDEAEKALNRAIAIWDNRADTRIRLAEIAMERGDCSKAERHLFRALEIQPGDPDALALLGNVFARTGRGAEARQFREAASRERLAGY